MFHMRELYQMEQRDLTESKKKKEKLIRSVSEQTQDCSLKLQTIPIWLTADTVGDQSRWSGTW